MGERYEKPVDCSVCSDTRRVLVTTSSGDEYPQLCTSCPVPCEKCRGKSKAYCREAPCPCACHWPAGGPEPVQIDVGLRGPRLFAQLVCEVQLARHGEYIVWVMANVPWLFNLTKAQMQKNAASTRADWAHVLVRLLRWLHEE